MRQSIDAARMKLAVRIDDDHDVRGIELEMTNAEIEGMTFSAPGEVVPFDDFRTGG